jgi:heat-inducible transcriptional repressor
MLGQNLSERAQHLLKILVNRYIREGQPIGSRTLSREATLTLSPATIRNIMADLEEMGLVHSPHTSAGRIPTVRGYRLFVDNLLQIKPLSYEEEQHLRRQFTQEEYDNQRLFAQTSNLLSEITHFAGLVSLPKHDSKALRHVEFLSLSKKRVLAILVFNEQEVENRIIYTSRNYSPAQLQSTANYLNKAFIGKNIKTVRQELLHEMQKTREDMDKIMQAAIEMADKAFENDEQACDFVMTGQTNLMEIAELSNIEKLRDLFIAFGEKQDILHLFAQTLKAQNMQVFIGEESGYEVLCDCSIVTCPYTVKGGIIGVIGVIGPTRMPYERIIPIVDLTAKLLGSALNHH